MTNQISGVLLLAGALMSAPAAADWLGGIAKSVAEKVGKNVASETAKEVAHQQGITEMDAVIDQAVHGEQAMQPGYAPGQVNYQQVQKLPTAEEIKLLNNASQSHPMGGAAAALSAIGVAKGVASQAAAAQPQAATINLQALFPNGMVGDYDQNGQITVEESTALQQMLTSQAATVQPATAQPAPAANGVAAGVVTGVMGSLFGRK